MLVLTSQLNDFKSQHIATKVTTIDNKTKKNASDILAVKNKLKQKEDTILNKELLLMEYGNFLKKNLFLIMKIIK